MKNLLFVVVLLSIITPSLAQNNAEQHRSKYRAWISTIQVAEPLKGEIYQIKDSSIIIHSTLETKNEIPLKIISTEIDYNVINQVKVRRKNSILIDAACGVVAGAIAGGIVGFAQGDDEPNLIFSFTAGEKAMIFGSMGAVVGGVFGTVSGLIKIEIPINRDKKTFNSSRARLLKYSYLK
jgi:hypothetical protein